MAVMSTEHAAHAAYRLSSSGAGARAILRHGPARRDPSAGHL
jgi:hypothetical protein